MTIAIVMTSAATADQKGEMVKRFLLAYAAGTHDYHEAFIGPNERPRDGPTAADTYATLAEYFGQPLEFVKQNITHADAEGRLDVKDDRLVPIARLRQARG